MTINELAKAHVDQLKNARKQTKEAKEQLAGEMTKADNQLAALDQELAKWTDAMNAASDD